MDNPCYGCEFRHATCHADCQVYKDFFENCRRQNEKKRRNKEASHYTREYWTSVARKATRHRKVPGEPKWLG